MKNWISEIIWGAIVIFLSLILKEDMVSFWCFYLASGVLGLIVLPFSARIFRNFEDRGWMFSKVLGIAAAGFLTWYLVSIRLLSFSVWSCLFVCAVLAGISILLYVKCPGIRANLKFEHKELIFWEEILFLLAFLMWTYLAGFNPQAYGTEKFMDYGFMEAMMRSKVMPPRDLWYSEGHINYYYGGQYFAVFLTKISGTEVKITYNMMRSFVAGLAFALPFSLVYQMTKDRLKKKNGGIREMFPAFSGFTAGIAVSIAGNMHYVVYCLVPALLERIQGVPVEERTSYWFPDATRYIGFQPDVPDKTIHEFPCYSFVLGDLHAHVVNIMFVLLVLGILYAYTAEKRTAKRVEENLRTFYVRQLLDPHVLLIGFLLGMFQWTNYWDFVIYYVVAGGVIFFTNIILTKGKARVFLPVTMIQAVEVFAIAYLVILPFTLQFDSMVDGVALAQYHSLPHQLLVLWGLPTLLSLLFLGVLLIERRRVLHRSGGLYGFMKSIPIPDLFAVVTALCAMGLILIPELVYVRDIYENGNARANTMFKLTYQAYILFGITMGYVIYRLFGISKSVFVKMAAGVGLFCLLLTCGYFGISVNSWYGDIGDLNGYQGLDAAAYIDYTFYEDAEGIHWLEENLEDVEVVLEANGDSYTDYNRVSAMTGLPTIAGWYVHEWLWRNDTDDLNQKVADVETIYTSEDEDMVRRLLAEYEVSYIFVGAKEREKYGDRLNHELLGLLGETVFQDEIYDTYIIKVE